MKFKKSLVTETDGLMGPLPGNERHDDDEDLGNTDCTCA